MVELRRTGARPRTADAHVERGTAARVTSPELDASRAPLSDDPPRDRSAEAKVVGLVETRPKDVGAIDRTLGKTLKLALGRHTLAANAANARHLEHMERSSNVVASIEKLPGRLGSIATFKLREAFRLYEHCFPNPDEREPVADIRARVKQFAESPSPDGADFHVHVFADADRAVVGYSQGSVVPSDAGVFYYWQYGCVADREYMRAQYGKDVNPRERGILNTIHGVNAATLAAASEKTGQPALGLVWESEPRGLGDDAASIKFTDTRLAVHTRAGGRVMIGRTAEGELINLHLQPRLTPDSEPIALHMMFRPLKYEEGDEQKRGTMKKADAESLMMAWIDNFRTEGFPEKDVAEAEAEIRARFARCAEIVLLPASEVPDAITLAKTDPILKKQILDMYGVDSLDAARKVCDDALRG
ncbi:hypothetical protein L6R52_07970 [Myxococcota bacterium]|nr:hypothetical protein [Myxococcota bacterium]